ncbi:MAG: PilC/PilY family type IV pilus protein [Candidatus Competibacteraceae bacterium]
MRKIQVYSALSSLSIGIIVQLLSTALAATLDLSSSPLFLANNVPPNILIIVDNSTSTDDEILTKSHWERAAYEYNYASGPSHKPTDGDQTAGNQLATCSDPNGDCGQLRVDGKINLSGPDLANASGCYLVSDCNGKGARNYLAYEYMSSCFNRFLTPAVCCDNYNCIDPNENAANCKITSSGVYSLASCPRTEALDWRIRAAALNVMYYNPDVNYKPWTPNFPDADFTAARSHPYPKNRAYTKTVNLGAQAPLGIDPTSCTVNSSGTTTCSRQGFVYYVWIDDKGFGNPPATCDTSQIDNSTLRPHRGACINMTDGPNGKVDLWDTHYKVIVTENSMGVEKITCTNTYNIDGSLNCTSTVEDSLPLTLIPNRKLNSGQLTLAEEKQNIANWFQYYRRRIFTIKKAVAEMPTIAPNYRYGLMTMVYNNSRVIIANDSNLQPLQSISMDHTEELMFEFPQSTTQAQFIDFQPHNQNMLDALFRFGYSQATFTRETLDRAGKYYTFKNGNNVLIPGTTIDPVIHACQRNYSLIITDGYYNMLSNFANMLSHIGDSDRDGFSTTLADVARYYYDRSSGNNPENRALISDLRSDFPNILNPTACDDPNNYPDYQHMVTFGVSLGASGLLNDTNGDGWPDNIVNPRVLCPPPPNYTNVWNQTANPSWANNPVACGLIECPQKIDDLWHAAYNGHGAYIFAQDPAKLESALRDVLDRARQEVTFSTSASSSSYYGSDNKVFLTGFDGQYWTGDLQAFTVDAQGNLSANPLWSAATKLDGTDYNNRIIKTYNPVNRTTIDFRYNNLPQIQKDALNSDGKGPDRVDFLSGKGALGTANWHEGWINDSSRLFRYRPHVLGDIIQSDPVYVGEALFHYDEYYCGQECDDYRTHIDSARRRTKMVYVGANDGMLHGFTADDGYEKIAYIPLSLIDRQIPGGSVNKLVSLSSRNYTHQYYIDGSATVGDAYISGNWKTILLGTLRAGGQTVFALDITTPPNFNVRWEFSDNDDPDLGYTFSKPVIARLHNGKWAAIFGNGYNNTEPDGNDPNDNTKRNGKLVVSDTGEAVLFVCYLEGSPPTCFKLSTGVGKLQDPTQAGRPNGLATPAVVDVEDQQGNPGEDLRADYVYVGDLFGNLWKFDIRADDPTSWQPPPQPLFKAVYVDNQGRQIPQPITVRPIVDFHPYGKAYGQMIYFGTGKYFENNDNQYSSATPQSFYGIWDNNDSTIPTITRSNLFQQEIQSINTRFRRTAPPSGSSQSISWCEGDNNTGCNRGWLIDFPLGEKQVSNPTYWNKRVIFTTLVLPQNPQSCLSDGSTSWLMVVDAADGGTLREPTFNLNGDSTFDQADVAMMGNQNASGLDPGIGALPRPGLIYNGNALIALLRGTAGRSSKVIINPGSDDVGRKSWRQLWR